MMPEVQSEAKTDHAPPWALPFLLLLFAGSGCAALIYEVVWLQLLQLIIGLTNISLGILLGTFMGGMCIGSLLLPKYVSTRQNPLRVYALLEVGIAILGIGILFLIPELTRLYTALGGSGVRGMFVRGALAALCLLPPTILMGATLPAVARWIETTRQGVSWLGFFYGGNIVGAVVGCLSAGFYFLRVYDPATATYIAAGLNVVVACVAFGLSTASQRSPRPAAVQRPANLPSERSTAVFVAIALSGAAALGAEVTWTRLLSLILGGTVYTFSIILAGFLIGLGIGSSAGAVLSRTVPNPRTALGWCQMFVLISVAWTAWSLSYALPNWPINPAIAISPWYTFELDLARCLWAILPAACLWGASFPLALAAVAPNAEDAGRVVGRLYAANTVGAILGALSFSLLIVPLAGTRAAQRVLIFLAGAATLISWFPRTRTQTITSSESEGSNFKTALAIAPVVVVTAVLAWSVAQVPWGIVAYGRFMATYGTRLAPNIVTESQVPSEGKPDIYCTYLGEGMNGSIAVTKWTSGVRNFHSAGKVQASNEPRDMRLQRMLGHLSALAHSKPESVLVVACGAGVTAGTFVLHPSMKRIVICDIEPLVPRYVAPLFAVENYRVVEDPRTQVVCDDGRHFIRTTQQKFDLITSDPIDPWVKGCAALNTVDYYEMCKAHLNPGGVMSLWIPLYESNSATVRSVIATFFKAFPNGMIFSNDSEGEGYDAVLLGRVEPTEFNLDALQERLNRPDHARVKQSLHDVGFNTAVSLLATYAGQASDLQDWLKDAQINTDRNLRLQYLAGMALNNYQGSEILAEVRRSYRFPEALFTGSDQRRRMLRYAIEGSGK